MEILSTSNVRSRVVRPYWFRLYAFDYGFISLDGNALFWMKRGHSIATRCIQFAHDVSLNIGTPIKSNCLAWFLRNRLHRVGLDLLCHSGGYRVVSTLLACRIAASVSGPRFLPGVPDRQR